MTARRTALLVALVLAAPALGGCVHRRMVIRSTPSGAVVVIDGERLDQRTPATVPFVWDGTRSVTLMAAGHHVLDAEAALEPRWYDWFPLDFVAEFLWPGTIEDERVFEYTLTPYAAAADDPAALRERAGRLLDDAARFRAGGSDGPVDTVPEGARPETPSDAPPPKLE